MPNLAGDGVVVILVVCISDPGSGPPPDADGAAGGCQPADYFGLTLPRKGEMVVGIIAVAVFVVLVDGIMAMWLLGRDIVTHNSTFIAPRAPRVGRPGCC